MLEKPRLHDYIVLGVFILVILSIGAVAIWQWPLFEQFFKTPETLRAYVCEFGGWAPVIFVGIYTVMAVLAVLPAYVLNIASSAMFGFWGGVFYSWLGTILGAFIVIVMMRRVALSVMRIIIPNEKIEQFGHFVQKYGWFYLFLLYLIPNPLGDLVNYVSAVSRIRIHSLLLMVAIGRLPTLMIWGALGTRVQHFGWLEWTFVAVGFVSLIALLYFFRKPLNRFAENMSLKLFPHPPHKRSSRKSAKLEDTVSA